MSIINFPPNPSDGMIFEVIPGLFYIYDQKTLSWNRVNQNKLPLATPLIDGLMDHNDFNKINNLLIPPPQTSLRADGCGLTFKSGTVGLYSTDGSLNIEHQITLKNLPSFKMVVPWDLGQYTAGYDFKLNINRVIEEAIKRGNLTKRQTIGPKGNKGPIGDDGISNLDTGPVGEIGNPGKNSVFTGSLLNENIQLSSSTNDGTRAIVNITTEENGTTNYLVLTRANIGNPLACPTQVSPKEFNSPWVLVIKPGLSRNTKQNHPVTDCGLVCTICSNSLYYINLAPIMDKIKTRYMQLVATLKQKKEDTIRSWLKVMIMMFNSQKAALCCALENCESRTRNQDTRRYLEQSRIAAAQSDHSIVIGSEHDKSILDMNIGKNCDTTPIIDSEPNIIRGDCTKGECTVKILLDSKTYSSDPRFGGSALKFFLPAGQYIAEIVGCCASTGSTLPTTRLNQLFTTASLSVPHFNISLPGASSLAPTLYTSILPIQVAIAPVNFNNRTIGSPSSLFYSFVPGQSAFKDYINQHKSELQQLLVSPDDNSKIQKRAAIFEAAIAAGITVDPPQSPSNLLNWFQLTPNGLAAQRDYIKNRLASLPRTNGFLGGSQSAETFITKLVNEEGDRVGLAVDVYTQVGGAATTTIMPAGSDFTGRVAILSVHRTTSQTTPILSVSPDFGTFDTNAGARGAYLGTTIPFNHDGGDIKMWVIDKDNNPNDNNGKIEVCIKSIACLAHITTSPNLTMGPGIIYLYREEVNDTNFISTINPFTGNITAATNYGLSNNNANLTFGPTLSTATVKVFIYEGSDGLSLFVIGNSKGGIFSNTRPLQMSYTFSGLTSSVAVANGSVLPYGPDFYKGLWPTIVDQTFGGAFLMTRVGPNWSMTIEPNDLDDIIQFEVDDGLGLPTTIIHQDPSGVGVMVSGLSGLVSDLIDRSTVVPVANGGPFGMIINNRVHGQRMKFTRPLDSGLFNGYGSTPVSTVSLWINSHESLDIQIAITDINNNTYTWDNKTLVLQRDTWQQVDAGTNITATDHNGNIISSTLLAGNIASITLIIQNTPTGTPLATIALLRAMLATGTTIILDDFSYNINIPFGSAWQWTVVPYRRNVPIDQAAKVLGRVASGLGTLWTFDGEWVTVSASVPAVGPFGANQLASINTDFNQLPLVTLQPNQCTVPQPKSGWAFHATALIAANIFIPSTITGINFTVRANVDIIVLVNNVVDHYVAGCATDHVTLVPISAINLGSTNVIGVAVHNEFGDDIDYDAYADIKIEGINSDPLGTMKRTWSIDATNNTKTALNKIVLSNIPPSGGCQMYYTKVQWYLRGHRIGAACSAYINLNGITYLVIKRSLGIDDTCGGGESLATPCIGQFVSSGKGHPAIAWPSLDGVEGLGEPTSGFVNFVVNDNLSKQVLALMAAGNMSHVNGNPAANIPFILFPSL